MAKKGLRDESPERAQKPAPESVDVVAQALKPLEKVIKNLNIDPAKVREIYLGIFEDPAYKDALASLGGIESELARTEAADFLVWKLNSLAGSRGEANKVYVFWKMSYIEPDVNLNKSTGKYEKTGEHLKGQVWGVTENGLMFTATAKKDAVKALESVEEGKAYEFCTSPWPNSESLSFVGTYLNEASSIVPTEMPTPTPQKIFEAMEKAWRLVRIQDSADPQNHSDLKDAMGTMVVVDAIMDGIVQDGNFIRGRARAKLTPDEINVDEVKRFLNLSFPEFERSSQITPGSKCRLVGTLTKDVWNDKKTGQEKSSEKLKVRFAYVYFKAAATQKLPGQSDPDAVDPSAIKARMEASKKAIKAEDSIIPLTNDGVEEDHEECVQHGNYDGGDDGCKECERKWKNYAASCKRKALDSFGKGK